MFSLFPGFREESLNFEHVSVCVGRDNTTLQTEWLVHSRKWFLTALEEERPQVKALAGSVSGEGHLPGSWTVSPHCALTWWEVKAALWGLLHEVTGPIHKALTS